MTFEYLANPGSSFVSLDDKLSAATDGILTGDIGQDIFNQVEAMTRRGLMMTGRQKYFLILQHLAYDAAHGFTHNILSISNLVYDGDSKLAHFFASAW